MEKPLGAANALQMDHLARSATLLPHDGQPNYINNVTELIRLSSVLAFLEVDFHNPVVDRGGGDKVAVAISRGLKENNVLAKLDLSGCEIGDEGTQAIGNALETNTSLTELNLSENDFAEAGTIAIADLLKKNKVLTKVDISENNDRSVLPAGDADRFAARFDAFARALNVNTTLKSLNLHVRTTSTDVFSVDTSAFKIAAALNVNVALTELSVRGWYMEDAAAVKIAKALETNMALRRLSLGLNRIKSMGVVAIANMLAVNRTLITLDLGLNDFYGPIASVLAIALHANSTLRELYLQGMYMCDFAASAFANALKVNTGLCVLHFGIEVNWLYMGFGAIGTEAECYVGDAGAIALAEAIRSNTALKELRIDFAEIGDVGKQALADAVTVNPNLKILDSRGCELPLA